MNVKTAWLSSIRQSRTLALLTRVRTHRTLRYSGFFLTFVAIILASAIVSTLTVDIGPYWRATAEAEGSRRLNRPVHVGRLGIQLARGRVVAEDVSIDGLHAGDQPFFAAKRLSVSLNWATAMKARPEFTVTSVELTDWQMLVERWEDGQSFPKLISTEGEEKSSGNRRFTTTLRYLRASRGRFTYLDHETPWSVDAPNIDLSIVNSPTYHGEASFSDGTVAIQEYVPMWANMKARFTLDGSRVKLEQVDLETDGARSTAHGEVDLARWPEQTFAVQSRLEFSRMRELFFARERWRLSGDADFNGTFHLFKGGHDLAGAFTSEEAGVDAYRFPALHGSLHWTRQLFEVTDAAAELYGGAAKFAFSIAPLGAGVRPTARFETDYSEVDLEAVSDFYELAGLGFAGRATGHNVLDWPLGTFVKARGEGLAVVMPPPGTQPMTAAMPPGSDRSGQLSGPFGPQPLPANVPVGGELSYRFDEKQFSVESGYLATDRTHVSFRGSTEWGEDSRFSFHVTSRDWQESDQVLAGILTNFGSPTRPVEFSGRGEFDGLMSGAFRRPRVEGAFTGQDVRAWDTQWGDGSSRVVVENGYVTIADGVVRHEGAEIRADGLFSLGYRHDGGEEIDARFRVVRRDVESLRHAFALDDYPVSGMMSGEFHLTGQYARPMGFGAMSVEAGVAYGQPFPAGRADLRFDGTGVRLDSINITAVPGSDEAITGAAFVGWDGTYSFNAAASGLPIEQIGAFSFPRAQPTGLLQFSAGGSGTFDVPQYEVRFNVQDLFVADEEVGYVAGTMALRGTELSGQVDVASPRLALTGTGRISTTAGNDADLTFRFHESSLDPYVRLFVPRLSPFTTAVASGTVRVVGELANVDNLVVDGIVDTFDARLLDYVIRNSGPIRLALDRQVVRVDRLQLVGEETQLTVGGSIDLANQQIALRASGDANLGILQGFLPNVRGSGRAELQAAVNGPLYEPLFSGSATITDGRVRHLSLPNSLDTINGAIQFDTRSVRFDDLDATVGGGHVQFGGGVTFDGYLPGELNVTARGEGIQLRYPEGVRSTVDADLMVRGNFKAPALGGTITVKSATWTRRIDPTGGLFDFGAGRASGEEPAAADPAVVPLRFDVSVRVPSTLRIENNLARLVARADLQLRGTYDRPLLFGRAEVDRGEVMFEGRRYQVTRGAIDFTNPTRIEPFFDVEAETRVRVPGTPAQTYRVIVGAAGTMERLQPQLSSDPPLPTADVLALLFSDVRRGQDAELRSLQNPNEVQTDILATRATQLLANPISAEVGRVVEQTFGVDAFQLSPSLIDPYSQSASQRVNPSARVTIGKRISERVYLTFSRSVSSSINDQLLLLEYDENDRLSWVLSRNEDETYAVEVRVRHNF